MADTALHVTARNWFWRLKHYLRIKVGQQGAYLENKMAESK